MSGPGAGGDPSTQRAPNGSRPSPGPIFLERSLTMPIIDSQVHAYERNHPGRPWVGTLVGPEEVTGDQMVAAMDSVGVDGAVLVSPFSMYGYDASYALEVQKKHPGKFCLVRPVDPNDPAVADTVADWAAKPGTVGVR